MTLGQTIAPLVQQAFRNGCQALLLCAGSAALVFAELVGALLNRSLSTWVLKTAR
ncbi:hypothetical protein [Pseudomonas putida]|uniref:hypothetical protein n=1 Tax=Pseudomonas putida TaxID=303 RepID=UPI0018D947F2|nr:hypothetical protein [Pseudomonas putida]MBH3414115.1 hypothetical protein [Pseudomonas putida]